MTLIRRSHGVDWEKSKRALKTEVGRAAGLMRSIKNPDAPALGEWSVAEVAMHLSQAWAAVPALAKGEVTGTSSAPTSLHDTRRPGFLDDIWTLGEVTRHSVRSDPERDLEVLARRIENRATAYLAGGHGEADDLRTWLVEGVEVGLRTLTCHLLNETIVHGWDMATADGRQWGITPAHAAMVFDGFVVPALQALGPRVMVNQEVAAGLHATYEMRVKGGGRHVFVFDDGSLSIEAPSSRPVDCIVTADPDALLLVVWKRVTQAKAIVERRLVASGPKAWLATRLPALMRIT
ncbi:MAG TPA: SCP2 sterol-binding domain-containing protein [Acidimicrobiales bacterium]|nr:SCP2 sterol-binding domain-containing protein [Acidimicrobiales bacterium]